jgi:hypothetical protein
MNRWTGYRQSAAERRSGSGGELAGVWHGPDGQRMPNCKVFRGSLPVRSAAGVLRSVLPNHSDLIQLGLLLLIATR